MVYTVTLSELRAHARRNRIRQAAAHRQWRYDCAMARRKIAAAGRRLRRGK